jgi:hypothetical protein
VARTLLDLAATVRPTELERALAQAERLRVYDHRAITDVIARSNGHRGTRVLAQATTREPKWTRNAWEAAFLELVRKAGLPEPLTNDALDAPDHGHCEPDYHWPSHQVIVETDGFETHGTRAPFATTAPRTPPSPPPATASSGSPATTTPNWPSSAYARCWRD